MHLITQCGALSRGVIGLALYRLTRLVVYLQSLCRWPQVGCSAMMFCLVVSVSPALAADEVPLKLLGGALDPQVLPGATPLARIEGFDGMPEMSPTQGYLARFELNSPQELKLALERAEDLFDKGEISGDYQPLVFVVHGPEVQIFLNENYQKYKPIVDLAAKLSAFRVVDFRVCETRLSQLGEHSLMLPPFIETVPFGPSEIERLTREENYLYF